MDMRALINLNDDQVRALDRLAKRRSVSRSELVREAISEYLHKNPEAGIDAVFGIWSDEPADGMEYQERIRREWDE